MLYLAQQTEQADNRITQEHLELVRRALYFDDTLASDVVTKRSDLRLVKADDAIGPILLEELHKSGQDGFVVYDDAAEGAVGTLRLQDAVKARQGGKVHEVMQNNLCYVHEDFNLREVQQALSSSGQQIAVVLNTFEEMVGAITLADLTRQLFGEVEAPDVAYDDKTSVAAYKPKKREEALAETDTTSEQALDQTTDEAAESNSSSSEATEVVE